MGKELFMKRLLFTALMLIFVISAAGCGAKPDNTAATASAAASATTASASAASGSYQTNTPDEVKKMMDNGDDIVVVDVRTAGEYKAGHLESAINVPVETIIANGKPAELPDTGAVIIVYCQTGNRSEYAAKELLKLGYTTVYDMGGIVDWPYDIVTTTEAASPSPSASDGVLSAFKATDISGSPVDASIFSGKKLTMVNIWATFCGPCLSEMPELGELNTKYASEGFQIVGIVIDAVGSDGAAIPEMVDTAKEIISKTGADYLHILPSDDLGDLLGQVSAVPTTIFVDESGNQVGEQYVGAMSGDEWASVIESLLKEVG